MDENTHKSPFVSKQAEFIYYLTQLSGKQRNKSIGITDRHYEDKSVADAWYSEVSKLVHPDNGGSATAIDNLNELYDVMTDTRSFESEEVE